MSASASRCWSVRETVGLGKAACKAARDWKRGWLAVREAADAAIDAACSQMGKSREHRSGLVYYRVWPVNATTCA
jgi:hypothetical protein